MTFEVLRDAVRKICWGHLDRMVPAFIEHLLDTIVQAVVIKFAPLKFRSVARGIEVAQAMHCSCSMAQ